MHSLRLGCAIAALTFFTQSCASTPDPTPAGGTGGTGGTGAAGGTGGAGAAAGSGGSGGAPAPLPDVGCDYTTAIKKSCAIAGCHAKTTKIGGLDLTVDADLRARLVNVPATFADIDCAPEGQPFMACVPATCPQGTKLIDTANKEQSVMLSKMEGTLNMCGDTMPMPPGNSSTMGWSDTTKACIETFIRALADGK